MTPNKIFMQYLRAVYIFVCFIFIFLFLGFTQDFLTVWKKHICNFLNYSKINSIGSFLTPCRANVRAKKSYQKCERTSICPHRFLFTEPGAGQVFHLHLVPAWNDICVQLAWVQPHFSIAMHCGCKGCTVHVCSVYLYYIFLESYV